MMVPEVEAIPYALPFREPYVTARGRLERRELVLVRVHADGLVGLGETAAASLGGGDRTERIVACLEGSAVLLTGAEVVPEHWARPAARTLSEISPQARAAIE